MGTHRTALEKFMNSFNLSFYFLPEKKIERDYGIIYCNVLNVYKGEIFVKEFRICSLRIKPGVWEITQGNKDILVDNLRKTIFVYLGVEDVADEIIEISQEYSEGLIKKGHFG